MSKLTNFNFADNWNDVKPYLNDIDVSDALNMSLFHFSIDQKYHHYNPPWNPDDDFRPWEYSISDSYQHEILKKFKNCKDYQDLRNEIEPKLKAMGSDIDKMLRNPKSKYYDYFMDESRRIFLNCGPQEGTYQWYQCFGAEHYYVHFEKRLAMKAFPNFKWTILRKTSVFEKYTYYPRPTVAGINSKGDVTIFSILRFEYETAEEILSELGINKFDLNEINDEVKEALNL